LDQNKTPQLYINPEYTLTLEELPSVSQDEIFKIVDEAASSSVVGND